MPKFKNVGAVRALREAERKRWERLGEAVLEDIPEWSESPGEQVYDIIRAYAEAVGMRPEKLSACWYAAGVRRNAARP